jgi:hypothetical protein
MTDKEARIKALKHLSIMYQLTQDINDIENKNSLTKDHKESKGHLQSLLNQIQTYIVEIGKAEGEDWKSLDHPEHILDNSKLSKYIGGYLGSFSENIYFEIRDILNRGSETN